jgi:hypothetical protein
MLHGPVLGDSLENIAGKRRGYEMLVMPGYSLRSVAQDHHSLDLPSVHFEDDDHEIKRLGTYKDWEDWGPLEKVFHKHISISLPHSGLDKLSCDSSKPQL